jgi:hypothetical protein
MSTRDVYLCQCPTCQADCEHPDKALHQQMNLLLSLLGDQERRLYAAIESERIGRGGVKQLSQITGLCAATIAKGRAELAASQKGTPLTPDRRIGGRPRTTSKYPSRPPLLKGRV